MKWYKHIADSLDDPFIFGLMEEFGHTGYVVFFGVLEIYAREFSVKDDWKLTEKLSFFRYKLRISCSRFKKVLLKIDKWNVEFNGDNVSIFIPKFKELMDESTLKKLRARENSFRNDSGTVPKNDTTDVDVDVDVEEDIDKEKEKKKKKKKKKSEIKYSKHFELFWIAWNSNQGKKVAYEKSWCKIPDLTEELCEKIIEGAKRYALERKNILAKGGTPKMAQGWLTDRRWEDEIMPQLSKPLTETEKKNKIFQAYLQDEAQQNEKSSSGSPDVVDIENGTETINPAIGALSGEQSDS